jgi:hypothetical protein
VTELRAAMSAQQVKPVWDMLAVTFNTPNLSKFLCPFWQKRARH